MSGLVDARTNKMQPGQVLVLYTAMADLMDGPDKKHIIRLLFEKESAVAVIGIMKKLLHAAELDAIQVPLKMAQDLKKGKSVKQVEKMPYRYKIEMLFYADPDSIPEGPHWKVIEMPLHKSGKISLQNN